MRVFAIVMGFFFVPISIHAQQLDTLDLTHSHPKTMVSAQKNSLRSGPVGFLYGFYKDFISPNDANSCVFYPSCSTYAVEAINKQGFINGSLSAADRLLRCNGSKQKRDVYEKKIGSDRYYDPVK